MTSEIAAAIEEIRELSGDVADVLSGGNPHDTLTYRGTLLHRLLEAACVLQRHLLAEHPANDAEPVTEEWLRSVGWKQWDATDGNDDFDLWLPANSELGWPCRLAWCVNGVYVVRMVDDEAENYLGTAESVELLNSRNRKKTITRGDVRALLRALKITLTEKDAHV